MGEMRELKLVMMRLNRGPVKCPECDSQVNPFVVQTGQIIILVECPNCKEEFAMPKELPDE